MTNGELSQELNNISPTALVAGLLKLELMRGKTKEIEFDSLKLSDDERRKRFGARIKLLRQALGLKQVDLAAKLKITPQAVSIYETGEREPNLKNLIAISRALGTTTDWLLGEPTAQ